MEHSSNMPRSGFTPVLTYTSQRFLKVFHQLRETYPSPPASRAFMLRVGVQFCTMLSRAASTSCLMKAFDSPALCSRPLAVASSSWSIPFCRPEYSSPKVTTAMRDTPERRFRTCGTKCKTEGYYNPDCPNHMNTNKMDY